LGSVRDGRQGIKVFNWILSKLQEQGHEVTGIDPLEYEELLVLKNQFDPDSGQSEKIKELQKKVQEADFYIAITPEYNHSYSGVLKNAIDYFAQEYERKCFGIVSYSNGGFGGTRAAEQLRIVCSEIKALAVPLPLSISRVQDVFDDSGKLLDEKYDERFEKFIKEVEWYAEALKNQRKL
jgi:NAD(P)H-dependent FMN reductase